MNKVFYCYSINLKNFLLKHGERFIAKDVHKKSNKTFWVFIGTDRLNKLLELFRNNNKNNI